MTTARLTLLGGFAVTFEDEPLRVSRAGQRLLALLCLERRRGRAPRSAAAERLWPDLPPGRAASNLRSVLWRLPRPRGRVLVRSDSACVWLDPDVDVDLVRAEGLAQALCAEPPPESVDEDLGLLDLDLLPDWDEPWLHVEQESYRQKRLHALERGAVGLRGVGRYSAALAAGLAAVRAEPLRETAHRQVIEVHLAEGNHAEALRQYDGYRRLLATELGLPPSPAIRALVGPLLGRPLDHR
ncbi:transcriptional regulator [Nocardioides sp. ChNu-153]|uniref:AfsR/SARP family transcriptional regulator n=1 Tax=unclassified Nocardioides TaxID=2615069 RepID=UPI0024061D11|nr:MULTISPECIES: BTAD domain-containing putative transcriptional regulator [unclassified Nocardioides]MDF9716105.1 hypothetical protein [Nocardioides sp. ChNu-99]MDN7122184.1 transcriptional regulator [Nocardioides sp. ChNu-153]